MKYLYFSKFSLILFLVLLSSLTLLAQEKTISGKVINQQTNEPLQGVSVNVKGTTRSVTTGPDGGFSIVVPNNKAVLVLSYIGFASMEAGIARSSPLTIQMSPGANKLDEVVVIGYGTVKRRDLTGSVSSIKGDELVQTPTSNVAEAMQGRVPGVDITRSSGAAGAGVNIQIRGTRTIRGAQTGPLYIIDGFQGGNISDLNPNDIESIDVLKDASSTAIYGAQGANGVIVVTTKKGTEGKTKVSYDAYYGINGYTSFPRTRLGEDYVQLRREAYRTTGDWASPADDPKIFPNAGEYASFQAGQFIDWVDLLNRNGKQQSHTVSIRGGSDKTRIFLSLGYFKEEGMLRRNDYNRYSVRFNLEHRISKWAKTGLLSQITYVNQDNRVDPLSVALSTTPLGTPYDSAGNINLYPVAGNTSTLSPLTDERGELIAKDNLLRSNVNTSAFIELTPFSGFTYRSNLGVNLNSSRRGIFNAATSLAQRNNQVNSASEATAFNRFLNWDNILTYTKKISDHSITITGVASYIQSNDDNLTGAGTRQLLSSQLFYNLSSTEGTSRSLSSGYVGANNMSFAGRLNYSYRSKYLVTVSDRADGASRLAPGRKWDYFPSVALGWNVMEENFMRSLKAISSIKLRASYGVAGNYSIAPYGTQSGITATQSMGFGDVQVTQYQFNPTIGNPDLGWEKSYTANIGLDFGLIKNRITGTIDVYKTTTKDILLLRNLPLSTGVSNVYQNVGETENKGIELSITSKNVDATSFKWSTTVTYTRNREAITKLINGADIIANETTSLLLGYPINSFYSYRKLGLWQADKASEAANVRFGTTPFKPGDIRVEDINGDSIIDTKDRVYLGSTVPKFVLGLYNTFSYKNFDLNVFLFMRYGQMLNAEFLGRYNPSGEGSGPANIDYWTPENPTNDFPRPRKGSQLINYAAYQALNFVDGSYFKIKTVSLGYTIPRSVTSKIHSDNIRVYVTGNNIFTKAKNHLVKDYDPERGGAESSPISRQFVFGLNIGF